MYTSFYQLQTKPFQICSDPSFIWLGEKHKEALATLKYGILDNKGFLLLTGDVGTGKTTLINTLIKSLSSNVIYASVPDPRLEKLDFFNYIATAFGIDGEFSSKGNFLTKFSTFLHKAYDTNKKILLIIDEAQLLTQDLLEEIRLLSNINKTDSHLLNIFFVGQNEFNEIINRPENRAVAQRLTLNYHIEPLTLQETARYISHRLEIAGTTNKLFDVSSIREIFSYSGGFPRRINIICDHCLLTGYAKEKKIIDASIVKDCANDLKIPGYKREQRPTHYTVHQDTVPLPPVTPKQTDSQPEKTRRNPLFLLISTPLLIVLSLVLLFLYYPDYFTTTYNSAITYFSSVKNKINTTFAAPPRNSTGQEPMNQTGMHTPQKVSEKGGVEFVITPKVDTVATVAPMQPAQPNPVSVEPVNPAELTIEDFIGNASGGAESPGQQPLPLPEVTLVVRFNNNSNDLSISEIEKIEKFARILKSYPMAIANISGYTDSVGTERYNIKLSKFRANIVKSFLLGQGVPAKQMRVQGLGSQNPVDSNDTTEGRMMNRRVEINVINSQN